METEKIYYIVFEDGRVGKIRNVCTCDKCKERGVAEVFIDDLDGGYLDCLKANDIDIKTLRYFGESLTEAIDTFVKDKERMKLEMSYLQGLLDYYSSHMVEKSL